MVFSNGIMPFKNHINNKTIYMLYFQISTVFVFLQVEYINFSMAISCTKYGNSLTFNVYKQG